MKCINCGCENDDRNAQCEVCGAELEKVKIEQKTDKKSIDKNKLTIILLIVAIAIVIIVAIAVIANLTKSNENTYDDSSNFAATEGFTFDDTTENETEFEENATKATTTKSTTEATTLSEEELNRKKALEYIEKANSALKDGEREGALQMADAAIEHCSDSDIREKYEEIYEYAPFDLSEKNNVLFEENNDNVFIGYHLTTTGNDNNEYSNGLLFYGYKGGSVKLNYNLSGKYDVISGTVLLPQEWKNGDYTNNFFEIYGDGKKLYTSDSVSAGFLPKDFSVKVTGVDLMVIKYYAKNGENNMSRLFIADFSALKNLP